MLKPHSALDGMAKFEAPGIALSETPNFKLNQISGEENALKRALGELPQMGIAASKMLRISPSQVWILGEAPEATRIFVTPLSSSRTRLLLDGEKARALLQSCTAFDFSALTKNQYVMTGMHHVPVLIHCIGKDQFHIYVMRTFALSIWDWLVDATGGLNHA
jgi:heterotetrameric sarcosine oxidase gamma subunit